jgi:hypothetical protein
MQQGSKQGAKGASQEVGVAILGVLFLFTAGFVLGVGQHSSDPELTAGFFLAFLGAGSLCVLAGGIAIGIRLTRS